MNDQCLRIKVALLKASSSVMIFAILMEEQLKQKWIKAC